MAKQTAQVKVLGHFEYATMTAENLEQFRGAKMFSSAFRKSGLTEKLARDFEATYVDNIEDATIIVDNGDFPGAVLERKRNLRKAAALGIPSIRYGKNDKCFQ